LGITFVAFVLTELVPSNAATTNLGEQAAADPAAVKAFEEHYGLDKPLPVRYWIYLKHLVHGDLGQSSVTHQAVTHDLGTFIPATAELAIYSILIAALVGITFGVIAGLRRNRPADHALRVTSLAGISMPVFWIALVVLYLGFYRLGWFPGGQRLDPGTSPPPSVTRLYTLHAPPPADPRPPRPPFHPPPLPPPAPPALTGRPPPPVPPPALPLRPP